MSKYEYLDCNCESPYCVVRIYREKWDFADNMSPGFMIQTQLDCAIPLWSRIWTAIKYIFRIADCNRPWSDCDVDIDSARKLKKHIDAHLQDWDVWNDNEKKRAAEQTDTVFTRD